MAAEAETAPSVLGIEAMRTSREPAGLLPRSHAAAPVAPAAAAEPAAAA
jgi:hypothetical protein